MKTLRHAVALALACSLNAVQAQGTNPFNGEWQITMYDEHGIGAKGGGNIHMVVNGDKGTYQNRSPDLRRGETQCNKLIADLEKVSFTDSQLDVTVNRSSKLGGCTDFRVVFARDGDKLIGRVVTTRDGVDRPGRFTLVAKRL